MMKNIILLIAASFLSACSLLEPEEALPLYTLKSGHFEPGPCLPATIAIDIPSSEASLNTPRIALTPSPYERDYFAGGQWPERLPKIMQGVLIESLSDRWGGDHVSRIGAGLQVKYLLQTEIQDFAVYYLNTPVPEVRLKISFKLVDLKERKVVAGQVFSRQEPVCASTMKGIVEAFNKGFQGLLLEAIPWMEASVLNRRI